MRVASRSAIASAIAFALLHSSTVRAQSTTIVKPEFLLIVDTSGSMVTATGAANSCGYVDTRQNSAACAVRNLADGSGDAIFGLATYGMTCSDAAMFHYVAAPANGCGGATGSTCINTFPTAIPATGNPAANNGFPFPFYGCDDGGTLWVPPIETQQYQMRAWGDASFTTCTSMPAPGAVGGPELSAFARGFNPALDRDTPLAGSLNAMARYLRNRDATHPSPYVNFDGTGAPDPFPACRPMNIILLTDGQECCDNPAINVDCSGTNTPIGAEINARNIGCLQVDLNNDGVISNPVTDMASPYFGRNEGNVDLNHDGDCYDANEQIAFKTKVYVIGFGITCGTALGASIEGIAQAGGVPQHGVTCGTTSQNVFGYYAANEADISTAINSIIADSALRERCNGIDDNCNGQVDEDFAVGPRAIACTVGVGACRRTGTTVCSSSQDGVTCSVTMGNPSPENTAVACSNGVDDDCDGFTDCGDPDCATVPSCQASCVPSAEICDGRDNNCNGTVDEGSITRPCGNSLGICTVGTQTCQTQPFPGSGVGIWGACSGVGPGTEICDGVDNNCNGVADEGLTRSCGMMVGACRAGVQQCTAGSFSGPCVGSVGPTSEVCDGVDNDCDGMTDNAIPSGGPCGSSGIGVCTTGQIQCLGGTLQCVGGTAPGTESCNGLDDDCNGLIDDGIPSMACTPTGLTFPTDPPMGNCRQGATVCRGGAIVCDGAVGPQPEICDGIDNNCNGTIDEGLAGTTCGSSIGVCRPGMLQCDMGRSVCVGNTGPSPEICNGLDDNCNGMTDEGNPGGGVSCGSSVGECMAGVSACRNGMIVCDGGRGPMPEICDGLDNNCNGMIDDGVADGDPCGSSMGVCQPGVSRCRAGHMTCVGGIGPHPEECNCLDDDCNGMVDDMGSGPALCGAGSVCAGAPYCQCLRPCGDTEFPCPVGRMCAEVMNQRLCVGDPCQGVTCDDSTQRCLNGTCVSRCQGVNCDAPLICNPRTGRCVVNGCRALENCSIGQICRNDTCIDDPCSGLSCPADQACYNGHCGASCPSVMCVAGQTCVQGLCQTAGRCASVICQTGQICNPADGTCLLDRCMNRLCQNDQICDPVSGGCVDDPCAVVRCPAGQTCAGGDCHRPTEAEPPARDRVVSTGGGGLACNVGLTPAGNSDSTGISWALSLLALVALIRRKRRNTTLPLALLSLAFLVIGCRNDPYCLNCTDGSTAGDGINFDVNHDIRYDSVPIDTPRDVADVASDVDNDACMFTDGFDLQSDPGNCGTCGHLCSLPHAVPSCSAGQCVIPPDGCDTDFFDLDHDPSNGCEYGCTPVPGATDDATCDHRDDNCNGHLDEDVNLCTDVNNCGACGQVCLVAHATAQCVHTGTDACGPTNTTCQVGACNPGFDDIDHDPSNGCEYACTPSGPEVCDGIDNDCNGTPDDGDPGGGGVCGSSVGACRAGVNHCMLGHIVCVGEVVPVPETCNAIDDDCNGMADDGALSADNRIGTPCGSGVGDCQPGRNACMAGAVVCSGGVMPIPEVCDGRDNNCDGQIDNGVATGGSCGTSVGACSAGTLRCTGGAFRCQGAVGPMAESCNAIDDDCDGTVDNGFDLSRDPANCGQCGHICMPLAHAITACQTGSCALVTCLPGFVDLDRDPSNGCEYACNFASASEICNGRDDNCNGVVDEGVAAPAGFCRSVGPCAGAIAVCSGTSGFTCSYGANVEVDPSTGQPVAVETRCDGIDNNCNGSIDESFPTRGTACSNGGVGGCGAPGTFVCNAAGTGVTCNAPPVSTPSAELCDGIDNDCDGSIDETAATPGTNPIHVNTSWIQYTAGTWIMQYEASRPGASSASQGIATNRACSSQGVLPWTSLTEGQAAAACTSAGARLCTETEWHAACVSSTGSCTWSYASTCTAYSTSTCNGVDNDISASMAGVQNGLLPTGSLASCIAHFGTVAAPLNIFDMSGNAKEFTAPRAAGVNPLRGGSYNNIANGTSCGFSFTVVDNSFSFPNAGFRCCFSGTTPP